MSMWVSVGVGVVSMWVSDLVDGWVGVYIYMCVSM